MENTLWQATWWGSLLLTIVGGVVVYLIAYFVFGIGKSTPNFDSGKQMGGLTEIMSKPQIEGVVSEKDKLVFSNKGQSTFYIYGYQFVGPQPEQEELRLFPIPKEITANSSVPINVYSLGPTLFTHKEGDWTISFHLFLKNSLEEEYTADYIIDALIKDEKLLGTRLRASGPVLKRSWSSGIQLPDYRLK